MGWVEPQHALGYQNFGKKLLSVGSGMTSRANYHACNQSHTQSSFFTVVMPIVQPKAQSQGTAMCSAQRDIVPSDLEK